MQLQNPWLFKRAGAKLVGGFGGHSRVTGRKKTWYLRKSRELLPIAATLSASVSVPDSFSLAKNSQAFPGFP